MQRFNWIVLARSWIQYFEGHSFQDQYTMAPEATTYYKNVLKYRATGCIEFMASVAYG